MLLRSASVLVLEPSAAGTSRLNASVLYSRRGLAMQHERTLPPGSRRPTKYVPDRATNRTNSVTDQSAAGTQKEEFAGLGHTRAIPDSQKRLLSPYELSMRVKALCDKGELKQAITKVKEAPRDAQNAIVWSNLIREVMKARKYKEAYHLFTDMKRRGFSPTTRTFGTMLGGYAVIEDWDKYPLQLENVYSLYDQMRRYHAQIISSDPRSPELTHIPYTLLIQIFGQAQQFQRMYDVFNAMPSEGPLAPNLHTFTALLNAIATRKSSALSVGQEESEVIEPTYHELQSRNASDAKLIWRQLLRASTKAPGFPIDSHALRALLKILSRGRPSDQDFAFEIVQTYLGLARPGQTALPAKVELHPLTLESLLHVCNNSKRYTLTLHYVQQVIDSDSGPGLGEQRLGLRRILNTKHMDLVLEAHVALASLGASGEAEQALETLEWMLRMQATAPAPGKEGGIGPQIRPTSITYDLVLLACWRDVDWKSACRAFGLMTGYDAEHFYGQMTEPPKREQRSSGRALVPSAAFMSSLIRTANKTHHAGNVQQALNIFEHYGWDTFFQWDPTAPIASRKQEKDWAFYGSKLAQALVDGLPVLLKSPDYDKAAKARWENLLRRAIDQARAKAVRPRRADTDKADGTASRPANSPDANPDARRGPYRPPGIADGPNARLKQRSTSRQR